MLDDDIGMLQELENRFRIRGWITSGYSDIDTFESQELSNEIPTVFIIDHDLGGPTVGYEVVGRIRSTRADGLAVPIIYLTGRESERGFLEKRLDQPSLRPSSFVNKNQLASIDLLKICDELLSHYRTVLQVERNQTLRRAINRISNVQYSDEEDMI